MFITSWYLNQHNNNQAQDLSYLWWSLILSFRNSCVSFLHCFNSVSFAFSSIPALFNLCNTTKMSDLLSPVQVSYLVTLHEWRSLITLVQYFHLTLRKYSESIMQIYRQVLYIMFTMIVETKIIESLFMTCCKIASFSINCIGTSVNWNLAIFYYLHWCPWLP